MTFDAYFASCIIYRGFQLDHFLPKKPVESTPHNPPIKSNLTGRNFLRVFVPGWYSQYSITLCFHILVPTRHPFWPAHDHGRIILSTGTLSSRSCTRPMRGCTSARCWWDWAPPSSGPGREPTSPSCRSRRTCRATPASSGRSCSAGRRRLQSEDVGS